MSPNRMGDLAEGGLLALLVLLVLSPFLLCLALARALKRD